MAVGERDLAKAALRGEPSYVWRAGQERRLEMILAAAGERAAGRVLDDGCGVGAGAPICSGTTKFPNAPIRIGMIAKKIMIVACIVKSEL